MKKLILSALSFLMVFSATMTSAFALEDDNLLSQEIIEIADKYIVEEGTQLVVSSKEELMKEIGEYNYNIVLENIEFCNELVDEGLIGVKENGSLYVIGDDTLVIQGGNINDTRLYWWGWHRYNDNANTKKIITSFRKQESYADSVIAQIIFGGLNGIPGGFAIAAIPKLVGDSLKSFANELESKNKGYGTIIAANWVVVGSNIKSQSKNTK